MDDAIKFLNNRIKNPTILNKKLKARGWTQNQLNLFNDYINAMILTGETKSSYVMDKWRVYEEASIKEGCKP